VSSQRFFVPLLRCFASLQQFFSEKNAALLHNNSFSPKKNAALLRRNGFLFHRKGFLADSARSRRKSPGFWLALVML
jgi:hypothetical protein